ncbi:flagellar basal body-associated FliL family protein [Syntrophothermus lipocalidus]|uniref:Flagellar protein FliL n=1 Tax=Syntrophothermus lipocalidus (strain DSM 12680 / TGB-C1) TaxID=643648 RepID=D7CM08_SYNLT|nr:flagellar basal body-associated FliL family protein [Syntrophothermus lipocalidus]ADI01743.1 flagellar basal body-associated protein FliL [Syntrophothermus lipocalidus DSM 12680]HOV43055.1 flagellar basal body-associated FliL family protein [Syntrophothermus lipocalidus]
MAEEKNNGDSKEKSSKSRLDLQIIVVGLVVFLMCMGGAYFMIRSLLAPLLPQEEEKKSSSGEVVLVEAGEFTTNIYDINGTRYLKAEVYLQVPDKKVEKELETVMPVVKDEILSILSSQTVADLDVRNRDNLRKTIKERLNRKLGGEKVTGVYFTSFIVQ